ncbi:phage major capsid protein [Tropicimonas isoalkanivorans]|uniref:Phage major capsid protein, HK97 family n=1 Tax=Tropicimonas isoalkanivorans TaxID=441112 RepID=A0A1I1E5F5_9RHOB|nr:phage major capsid protein [Tropicimonas isoalkanivorans]SFB82401.1 phage major capsid protein, HK97 family [Tropicimonas isoalkanivorans]
MKHFPQNHFIRKGDEDDPVDVVTKAVKDLTETVDERLATVEKKADTTKLVERLDKLEAKTNRAAGDGSHDKGDDIEKKALSVFLRSGVQALDDVEKKTLNLGTNTAGGYVVAPEFSTRILQGISEQSPMRSVANTMSIGTTEVYIPKLVSNVQPGWVTEMGPRPTSEPAFDQQKIEVFEQAVIVPVSQHLLEDSFIDLEAFLRNHIAREFAKMEAAAFVNGDGNGKPTGFLADAASYQSINVKDDGSDFVDALMALYYALPTEYARRATWALNRKSLATIRGLKDANGAFIWQPGLTDSAPSSLFGRPVVEMVDMPDLAAGAYPVAFGDFHTGYQIVDRIGIQTMRDDYTGADNGIVKIRARRRVGGATVMPEAIAVLEGVAA